MIITKHEFQLRNQLKMISSTSSKHPHPHPILKEKTFILAFFWKKMGFTFTYRFPIFLTLHRSLPPFGGGLEIGLDRWCEVHSNPPLALATSVPVLKSGTFLAQVILGWKVVFCFLGIFPMSFVGWFFFSNGKMAIFFGFLLASFWKRWIFLGGSSAWEFFFVFLFLLLISVIHGFSVSTTVLLTGG